MRHLFLFFLIPIFGLSQHNFIHNIYLDTDVHLATSFEKIVANVINSENTVDYKLSIGGSAFLGYQPISRIGIGTGFKYSFLGTEAGTMFVLLQPKIFFGEGEEGSFVYLNFGKGINKNLVRNSRLYGIGISDVFSEAKRHSFFYGVFLENQRLDFGNGYEDNFLFGGKIGITINTRKYSDFGEN